MSDNDKMFEDLNRIAVEQAEYKSQEHPYKFKPKNELSNKDITEILKILDMKIGTDVYNNMSTGLKRHFDKD